MSQDVDMKDLAFDANDLIDFKVSDYSGGKFKTKIKILNLETNESIEFADLYTFGKFGEQLSIYSTIELRSEIFPAHGRFEVEIYPQDQNQEIFNFTQVWDFTQDVEKIKKMSQPMTRLNLQNVDGECFYTTLYLQRGDYPIVFLDLDTGEHNFDFDPPKKIFRKIPAIPGYIESLDNQEKAKIKKHIQTLVTLETDCFYLKQFSVMWSEGEHKLCNQFVEFEENLKHNEEQRRKIIENQ